MAGDSSIPIDKLFKSAVAAVAIVDDSTWAAYEFLAEDMHIGGTTSTNSSSRKEERAQLHDDAREKLRVMEGAVYTAGLISRNDILDDISTASLKYVLVPYLRHRLLAAAQDRECRLESLRDSKKALLEFLENVNELGLLEKTDAERYLEGTAEEEYIPTVMAPGDKRAEKIARFRAEKAAAEKFRAIIERRNKILLPRRPRSSGINNNNNDAEYYDGDIIDEEVVRQTTVAAINSAIRKGLDDIENLDTEIALLEYAEKERAVGRDPRAKAEALKHVTSTTGSGGGIIEGMPATFRIVSRKEEMKRGVFRPSHTLPTYTVEEWGEIEMKNMAKREAEKKEAEIFKAKQREDENSEDEADRSTMEKRSWDDWRDENNKGSGNTMR